MTIGAMGCQKCVAQGIVKQKAGYVLALKGNHPTLHNNARLWLDDCDEQGHVHQHRTLEKDHGRVEQRRVAVNAELDWLPGREQWASLQAVAMVESTRQIRGKSSVERRYYLSSIREPARIAAAIRERWRIENPQHRVLDVQFGEEAHRARKDHSAASLGVIRRAAR